jgi:hypothetical protein
MVHSYASHRSIPLISLLLLVLSSPIAPARGNARRLVKTSPHGQMIRLAGKLVERSSQRPLRRASIMVKCGDMVLANRQSNEEGEFVIFIPPEKVSCTTLSIKIKYQNHIFIKDEIDPTTQELLIEINGAVFLESTPINDYQLPMHELGQPQVGRVLIRTRYEVPAEAPIEIVRTRL